MTQSPDMCTASPPRALAFPLIHACARRNPNLWGYTGHHGVSKGKPSQKQLGLPHMLAQFSVGSWPVLCIQCLDKPPVSGLPFPHL